MLELWSVSEEVRMAASGYLRQKDVRKRPPGSIRAHWLSAVLKAPEAPDGMLPGKASSTKKQMIHTPVQTSESEI
jgi:hypothetical protein